MGGYYIPSGFSANYVANKKNEDGTRVYDSAVNQAGIDAQRNLQQLNKQYNVTINQAYASNLLANRGLQASALGTGYKDAYTQNLQASTNEQINQASLSVADTKYSIFSSLSDRLAQIGGVQQQEVNNMRRMASTLEQYHDYAKTLQGTEGSFAEAAGFTDGTFEDNYEQILGINKGSVSGYVDQHGGAALSYEDWMRQNSGTSDEDTAWLDWAYDGGLEQYKNFIAPRISANKKAAEAREKEAARLAAEEAMRAAVEQQANSEDYWSRTSNLQGSLLTPQSSTSQPHEIGRGGGKELWDKFWELFKASGGNYDGRGGSFGGGGNSGGSSGGRTR